MRIGTSLGIGLRATTVPTVPISLPTALLSPVSLLLRPKWRPLPAAIVHQQGVEGWGRRLASWGARRTRVPRVAWAWGHRLLRGRHSRMLAPVPIGWLLLRVGIANGSPVTLRSIDIAVRWRRFRGRRRRLWWRCRHLRAIYHWHCSSSSHFNLSTALQPTTLRHFIAHQRSSVGELQIGNHGIPNFESPKF